jgi:hypothetical protein
MANFSNTTGTGSACASETKAPTLQASIDELEKEIYRVMEVVGCKSDEQSIACTPRTTEDNLIDDIQRCTLDTINVTGLIRRLTDFLANSRNLIK